MVSKKSFGIQNTIPIQCEPCCRRRGMTCSAYIDFFKGELCPTSIYNYPNYLKELKTMYNYNIDRGNRVLTGKLKKEIHRVNKLMEREIQKVMKEDQRRGSGGGGSDSESNSSSMKQRMKDNRAQETKPNRIENKEYLEELRKWEEENGKLEKHRPNFGLTRSKKDSYIEEDESC